VNVKLPWRRGETPVDGFVHEPLVLPEPPNPGFYDPAWDEWDVKKGPSRRAVIIVVVLAILAVGGFIFFKSTSAGKTPSTGFTTPTTFSIAQTASTPTPTTFSGKVSATTPSFTVGNGLTVLAASCNCTAAKFEIQVLDATGNVAATPIETTGLFGSGTFAGSVPLSVPQGTYTLQVSAIGPWKVTVTSPPPNQPTLPLAGRFFGGSGPSIIGPFAANRDYLVLWAFSFNPTPVKLQVINSVTGAATTIKETSGTAKPSWVRVPAQQAPFYLYQGDTQYLWGLLVKPAN